MSISIERFEAGALQEEEPRLERDGLAPLMGRDVPSDPIRALRGVLWSVTLARFVLVPVFLAGALRAQELARLGVDVGRLHVGLLLTLGVIAGSDMLDGWIARRYGMETQGGAIADALADRLVQVALVAFFTFVTGPAFAALPLGFFVLLVGRDIVLGGGWLWLRAHAVPFRVVHRIHGRAATAGVFTMLFWLTARLEPEGLTALMVLTAALIWVSASAYVADAYMAVRHAAATGAVRDGADA